MWKMDAEAAVTAWTVSMLPPMPAPDSKLRSVEARRGMFTVLYTIAICVGLTHGVGLQVGRITGAAWWVFLALIYTMAATALLCLFGLLCGDPGVVRRSEETCFPIPEEVQCRLKDGASTHEGLSNIVDGDRTYCVRCLVWRNRAEPSGGVSSLLGTKVCAHAQPHHCRTCNRCVRSFDHHCGVFGRCIAGRGMRGNMKYFVLIIVMGYGGVFVTFITVAAGLIIRATREGGWDAD